MTTTLTLIDDTYSANDSTGRKRIFASLSIGNPYTAAGESLTISSYFPNKFLGGKVMGINPSVSIQAAGVAHTGTFRADTSSTSTVSLQFFDVSLGGSTAGLFVDNTINLQSCTVFVEMIGY